MMIQSDGDVYMYEELISEQEYIAIRVHLQVESADPNQVFSLYPAFSLTLRFDDAGGDIWTENLVSLMEGYPPLGGQFWMYYIVRIGSTPKLYFQPQLMVEEQIGIRTTGAYLNLQ